MFHKFSNNELWTFPMFHKFSNAVVRDNSSIKMVTIEISHIYTVKLSTLDTIILSFAV